MIKQFKIHAKLTVTPNSKVRVYKVMMNLNQRVKQNQGTYGLCHTEVYPFIGDTGFAKNEIMQD